MQWIPSGTNEHVFMYSFHVGSSSCNTLTEAVARPVEVHIRAAAPSSNLVASPARFLAPSSRAFPPTCRAPSGITPSSGLILGVRVSRASRAARQWATFFSRLLCLLLWMRRFSRGLLSALSFLSIRDIGAARTPRQEATGPVLPPVSAPAKATPFRALVSAFAAVSGMRPLPQLRVGATVLARVAL